MRCLRLLRRLLQRRWQSISMHLCVDCQPWKITASICGENCVAIWMRRTACSSIFERWYVRDVVKTQLLETGTDTQDFKTETLKFESRDRDSSLKNYISVICWKARLLLAHYSLWKNSSERMCVCVWLEVFARWSSMENVLTVRVDVWVFCYITLHVYIIMYICCCPKCPSKPNLSSWCYNGDSRWQCTSCSAPVTPYLCRV